MATRTFVFVCDLETEIVSGFTSSDEKENPVIVVELHVCADGINPLEFLPEESLPPAATKRAKLELSGLAPFHRVHIHTRTGQSLEKAIALVHKWHQPLPPAMAFKLPGHPEAQWCYAHIHLHGGSTGKEKASIVGPDVRFMIHREKDFGDTLYDLDLIEPEIGPLQVHWENEPDGRIRIRKPIQSPDLVVEISGDRPESAVSLFGPGWKRLKLGW